MIRSLTRAGFERRNRLAPLLRGILFTALIRACGGTVGRGLRVDRGVYVRHAPSELWRLGQNVYFGANAVIDVASGGVLRIGNRTKIMSGCLIGVQESVHIGSDVLIAESTSIRDADHGLLSGGPISQNPMRVSPVAIHDGAWIGRGCAILAGSLVHAGGVVGANSVIKGIVEAEAIHIGPKATFHRFRKGIE